MLHVPNFTLGKGEKFFSLTFILLKLPESSAQNVRLAVLLKWHISDQKQRTEHL